MSFPITLLAVAQIVTASPDKSIAISIADDGSAFSVARRSEPLILDSSLGLDLSGETLDRLELKSVERRAINRTLPLVATKAARAGDVYNATTLTFRAKGDSARTLKVEVRAYNDGVAFRYVLPDGGPIKLREERTQFRFDGDLRCLTSEYRSSHENIWTFLDLSAMDVSKTYDIPAVCTSKSGRTTLAIAQSDLSGYTSSALVPTGTGFHVKLAPRVDDPSVAVISDHGLTTAWRVLVIGDRAGDLIPSPLIGNLAPRPAGDFTWVKPGKAAWDWWSGPTNGEKPTMERFRRFIDFAAENKFPYFLIDAGWAYNATGCCDADPKTDITRADPAIDMPNLVAYAKARGVGLLLWVHWKHIEPRMDEVLRRYAEWGIKGIKVDFMERDDQEMVAFYERLAKATAAHHLLLDMHGAFPPSGLSTTYPNYITQEGVLGAEYDKFPTKRVTASHNVHLAYTRMLLGPMDYTPGGFRNGVPENYAPTEVMPSTQTRRGQALAMYVVYDSPLQMVSDDPSAYRNAQGFEVLQAVPTAWDETRFVGGAPETYVALARRSGTRWYLGVMNNEESRSIDLPLGFLPKGRFSAKIWADGAAPTEVVNFSRAVDRNTILKMDLKGSGGSVIVIEPR
ncbi:glycosyl hydrolase [Caulobacter segnis]|uniref:Glycoside hydrolase 97 n=2 Tax=Caulobacter segnis TaxID=88688 RepID=D5VGH9_CAUST|nr:glycoside hydrolase family 97 protein [Caulobacter segnis]ADG10298.1 Glycoside hydrolase 97 [Caulobacter segnis ATCC 21756]AVQ02033.1 glycosyl hydrolase [Caulobacter segnis]